LILKINIRKKLPIFFFCLFGLMHYSDAVAQEIYGTFDCKVLSYEITSVEEGHVRKFKGRTANGKKGIQPGEKLIVKYGIGEGDVAVSLSSFNFLIPHIPKPYSVIIDSDRTRYQSRRYSFPLTGDINTQFSDGSSKLTFNDSWLHLIGWIGELHLERYYKEDWAGMFVKQSSGFGLEVDVVTLDCRHTQSAFESLIALVED